MLNELREQVCQANLELYRSGLVRLTWGNVSGIAREQGVFLIKPSGVDYAELKPEHLVAVDLEGRVVEGRLRPSSDTPTHLELYRAFPEIGGVAHTHSVHATAFAQACEEIPCFGTTHADHFFGPVPLARALTEQEVRDGYERNTGRTIVERFAQLRPLEVPAVLLPFHGPFTWGKDALDSVRNSIALETVAEMALQMLALKPAAVSLPRILLDKHHARKHGRDAYYGQKA